jgi:hypothetical protein
MVHTGTLFVLEGKGSGSANIVNKYFILLKFTSHSLLGFKLIILLIVPRHLFIYNTVMHSLSYSFMHIELIRILYKAD